MTMKRGIFWTFAVAFALAAAAPFDGRAAEERIQPALAMISPSPQAGKEVLLRVTLAFPAGEQLVPAMLDAASLRIETAGGKVLVPRSEGLKKSPVDLGGAFTVSRSINVAPLLQVKGCATVRAWWEYGGLASSKISFGVFEWPLDQVEAVIETDMGTMVAEFCPDRAPATVANFVRLSMEGFYDGLVFHRVIPGFMIQGGCPHGDGTGGPGYTIKAEFNDLSHERGVLSMARGSDPDSAGSQFFIMHADAPALDWNYTAFGRLVSGFEALDRIVSVETGVNPHNPEEVSRPKAPPKIVKITVRLKERTG